MSRSSSNHLRTLESRLLWLCKRVGESKAAGKNVSHDQAEAAALHWAISKLTEQADPAATAKLAAHEELVLAALAVATRYRTDCAQRGHEPRERGVEPGTGLQFDNAFTVPVLLLNRLAKAARALADLALIKPDTAKGG